jgi:NodT family efflux transporter outer membrane factor (OMF) lipoprotein
LLTNTLVSSLENNHALIANRYGNGLLPATEVYRAEEALASAKNSLPTLEAALASAEHALAVLAGRFPAREQNRSPSSLPTTPPALSAGIPSRLLQNRPDIEAAFLRVAAKNQQLAATIANRFPTINLAGTYGSSRIEFDAFSVSGVFWNFLADLALPVVDGGRRRAAVEVSRAALAEELARYRKTLLLAVQEVENALAGNRTAENSLAYTDARLRATTESMLLAEQDYQHGLADYLSFLQAQQNHIKAQLDHTVARRLLLTARISLFRVLGGFRPEPGTCPPSQRR